jgi:hypothetical protein
MEVKNMRKILAILVALALIMPTVLAIDTGMGIGIEISTEKFKPMIWMCDNRKVMDDNMEPGRITDGGDKMVERINNYAFEGEQISWKVLVLDKNGFEKIKDVYVSVGPIQGNGQYIEANCQLDKVLGLGEHEGFTSRGDEIDKTCNARIDEEQIDEALPGSMAYYTCTLTVETPESMHGEYWIAANVIDLDDQIGTFAENEYWFFNPEIALTFSGLPLKFGTVRPGTVAYSNTITVGNGAEMGSGVMLDMFVTGSDFYDPTHSGAKCPSTNQLSLDNFRYYATSGAYSTLNDNRKDNEGYVDIEHGAAFNVPNPFYDHAEVIQAQKVGDYYTANVLAPGSEMSVTFKLALPLPCNGDFSDGSIYFWGEAI